MGPNPNGPLSVSCDRSYQKLRWIRGPFIGSCWRFLGSIHVYTVIYIHREPIQNSGNPNDWLFGTTQIDHWFGISYDNWLVVEPTHLKNISQIESFPQVGFRILK